MTLSSIILTLSFLVARMRSVSRVLVSAGLTSVSDEPNTITLPKLEQASCGWFSHQLLVSFLNDPGLETFLQVLQEGIVQRLEK